MRPPSMGQRILWDESSAGEPGQQSKSEPTDADSDRQADDQEPDQQQDNACTPGRSLSFESKAPIQKFEIGPIGLPQRIEDVANDWNRAKPGVHRHVECHPE